jgi:dihydropteroate synthase
MHWYCRDRKLACDVRPLVMGILNVTPDSFSDGGRFADTAAAVAAARQMVAEGADIIDVGGESTRPGAAAVDAGDEQRRVVPVIKALAGETDVAISVDTMKASVAREAMRCGAHIINDVSALTHDAGMVDVAGEFGAGVVLMHMRGDPRTMQSDPQYDDVVEYIRAYLETRIGAATAAGLKAETLAVDPGIGFGKTALHNVRLIAHLERFASLGRPVLVGLSRKRFLGMLTGAPVEKRGAASLAGLACSVLNGAHVMRVHDVAEAAQAVRVAAAIRCPEMTDRLVESVTC